jgi:hypothetical protein
MKINKFKRSLDSFMQSNRIGNQVVFVQSSRWSESDDGVTFFADVQLMLDEKNKQLLIFETAVHLPGIIDYAINHNSSCKEVSNGIAENGITLRALKDAVDKIDDPKYQVYLRTDDKLYDLHEEITFSRIAHTVKIGTKIPFLIDVALLNFDPTFTYESL